MRLRISIGRFCTPLPFTLIGLGVLFALPAPSHAQTPPPAPVASATLVPPPAADPVAAAPPISGLDNSISKAKTALENASDQIQKAGILAAALHSDSTMTADLSLDARIQALNSLSSDTVKANQLQKAPGFISAQNAIQDEDVALAQAIQAANSSDPRLVDAKNLQEQLDDANSVVSGTNTGSLNGAVTDAAKYVAELAGELNAQIASNSLSLFFAADDPKNPPAPKAIRQNLGAGLGPLATSIGSLNNFKTVWASLKGSLSDDQDKPVDDSLSGADVPLKPGPKSCDIQVKALLDKLPDWFGRMIIQGEADDLFKTNAAVLQALKDNNRTNEALLNAPIKQATARTEASQLAAISDAWPKLVAVLEPMYPSEVGKANAQLLSVAAAITGYATLAANLDELLTGDMSKFVGDQVRLFYFTDVPRLMHVLNPTTHRVSDDASDPQAAAKTARQDLINAETAALASITAVNEAKTNLRNVQEEIRLVDARAADATKQAAAAHVLLQRIKKQQTDLAYKVAHPDLAATPDALQALKDQQITLDARVVSATTATGNADTAAAAAKAAQAQFATESAALPQKLLDAQKDATTARSDLDKQRVIAANLAQVESDALANARDNAPYLESTPRVTSNDPAQRVILFAYPDSKTLYIRGVPADVEKVKEIVADFDRPVPQARITLWTLQFNGSFSKDLSHAVQQVDHRLQLTRTNIGLVQDLLRDSIAYVVNKVAESSSITNGEDSNGRLRRYKFYQPEILDRLGYDLNDGVPTLQVVDSAPAFPRPGILYANDFISDDAFVTRFTLPDPIYATTLGEMMFVLSLAKQTYREAVILRFLLELNGGIPARLPGIDPGDPQQRPLGEFSQSLRWHLRRLTGLGEQYNEGEKVKLENLLTNDFFLDPTEAQRLINAYYPGKNGSTSADQPPNNLGLGAKYLLKLLLKLYNLPGQTEPMGLPSSFFPRFPSVILGSLEEIEFPSTVTSRDGTTRVLPKPYENMTPNQNEILLAIQAQARDNIAAEIRQTIQNIGDLPIRQRLNTPVAHQYRMLYLPLVGFLYTKFNKPDSSGDPHPMTWLQKGMVATGLLPTFQTPLTLADCEEVLTAIEAKTQANSEASAFQDIQVQDFQVNAPTIRSAPSVQTSKAFQAVLDPQAKVSNAVGSDRQAWIIAKITGQHNSLSRATPRVAAADDMIKRLVITAEDDLDHFFVQPALEGIRNDVSSKGMEFGSLQRESILVSNRLVARVDPRANADLELPGATNFLEEASQLASIADRFKQEQVADKVTSSGPSALAGALSLLGDRAGTALGIGAVASLLGDLLVQPAPPGEIYSINSGSLFQVTPIFDPSGQALRFQFDYVGTTDVREPDKTTNPSIPRVERHTVNTEVQLTNLELREVSRFEANSALGIPQVRTGGLPLIKHVPLLRDIPILGYFTETGGQKAVRQQSMIFAQTSIYPTVSDIINLLVDIPPVSALNTEPPPYLQLNSDEPTPAGGRPATDAVPAIAPPAGNSSHVGTMRRRDKAKKAASTTDFIPSPGMQS